MAHYDLKFQINHSSDKIALCDRFALHKVYETKEADRYISFNQSENFQKMRLYDPPVSFPTDPVTGEMIYAPKEKTQDATSDIIFSHRLILASRTPIQQQSFSKLHIVSLTSMEATENLMDILTSSHAIDSTITKDRRHTYWHDPITLLHVDDNVRSDRHDLGSFMEIEIKDPHMSTRKRKEHFTQLMDIYELKKNQIIPWNYRNIGRDADNAYGSLFHMVPQHMLQSLDTFKKVHFAENNTFIVDGDRKHKEGYIILNGLANVHDHHGETLRQISSEDKNKNNNIVGEMAVETQYRTAFCTAKTDIEAVVLPQHYLKELYRDNLFANAMRQRFLHDEVKRRSARLS